MKVKSTSGNKPDCGKAGFLGSGTKVKGSRVSGLPKRTLHYDRKPVYDELGVLVIRAGFSGTITCSGNCGMCPIRFRCFTTKGGYLDLDEKQWKSVSNLGEV